MLQRNTSGGVLHVSAWPTEQDPDRAPVDKGPGEVIDFPEPLAGFTPLDPDAPGTEPDQSQAAGPKPRRGAKAQPSDASTEGGEPA